MRFERFSFGSIRIDGVTYDHDVVIDRGKIHKRKKKPSKKFRNTLGHTPLSAAVMDEVKLEAKRRRIELLILPTSRAIEVLKRESADTNAILHLTC